MSSEVSNDLSIKAQVDQMLQQLEASGVMPPEAWGAYRKLIEELVMDFAERNKLQPGDTAPDFTLPNYDGTSVSLSALLEKGPVVLTFYRGDWCPFCNILLRTYQRALPQIEELGATLVAVSLQTPDYTQLTVEHKELTSLVLTDDGGKVIDEYGLLYTLPEYVRPFAAQVAEHNGGAWHLPTPSTFVIEPSGKIVASQINANYMTRMEPADILEALKSLQS